MSKFLGLRVRGQQLLLRRSIHEEQEEDFLGVVRAGTQYARLFIEIPPWRRSRFDRV